MKIRRAPLFLVGFAVGIAVWLLSPAGREFRYSRMPDAALVALTSGHIEDAAAWMELGKRMEHSKMTGEALSDYQHAAAANPGDKTAWAGVARLAVLQHDPQSAHEAAKKLIDIAGQDAPSLRLAGQTMLAVGDREAAKTALQRAAALRPEDAETWDALAGVLLDAKVLDQAVDAAQKATTLSPKTARYWLRLATTRRLLADAPGALTAIRRAKELAPDDAAILLELGTILAQTGKTPEEKQEAVSALTGARERMRGTSQEADALRTLGQFYLEAGRLTEARTTLEECLKVAPDNTAAQFALSRTLALQGKKGEAEALTRRFAERNEYLLTVSQLRMRLQREPDRIDLLNRLGALYAANDATEEARAAYTLSLQRKPDQPDIRRQLERLTP